MQLNLNMTVRNLVPHLAMLSPIAFNLVLGLILWRILKMSHKGIT